MGEAVMEDLTVAQIIAQMKEIEAQSKELHEEMILVRIKLLDITQSRYNKLVEIAREGIKFLQNCQAGDVADAAWIKQRDELIGRIRIYIIDLADETESPIYFYEIDAPYGCFSNFSPHEVTIDGKKYPTTEHYFQAQKYEHLPLYAEQIRLAESPKLATELGRSRDVLSREDWEAVKDDVMFRAVLAKVQAHPLIFHILLETGERELIEKITDDYYWGCGKGGTGKNMLGQTLMHIRGLLRSQADT
jgi:ribA/ribD-fused uncharacterized protein